MATGLSASTGQKQVGETAGQVWHVLAENSPMTAAKLVREVDAPRDVVMQAVGWLAREGKLSIEDGPRSRLYSLRIG